jgi:hypothetical protein
MVAALASLSTVAPAAHASKPPDDGRRSCHVEDARRWSKLASPPNDAAAMGALAMAAPAFSTPQNWQAETWFALGDELLLCRSDAPLDAPVHPACAGEWWTFGPMRDGRRAITGHDGWVCIAE